MHTFIERYLTSFISLFNFFYLIISHGLNFYLLKTAKYKLKRNVTDIF